MGVFQAEEPMFGKEDVRPTLVVTATAASTQVAALAENAPQAHPDPTVKGPEGPNVTVLEIRKPSPQDGIQLRNNTGETFP